MPGENILRSDLTVMATLKIYVSMAIKSPFQYFPLRKPKSFNDHYYHYTLTYTIPLKVHLDMSIPTDQEQIQGMGSLSQTHSTNNTGTRVLEEIDKWAAGIDNKWTFWLNGMTETGKSIIAGSSQDARKE